MEQFYKIPNASAVMHRNCVALKNTELFWISNMRLVNWELKIGALFSFVTATRSEQISTEMSLKVSAVKLKVKLKGLFVYILHKKDRG